jgi:MFS superfamily sulfate permease-like transporter
MLVVTALAVKLFGLESLGVSVIGSLPEGLPSIVIPGLHGDDLLEMLPAALAIAVVGFADTTLVSQGFAARNGYAVNSSRDLAALGAADLASGTFGGLPVSASSARTAVAESSGAHSQVAPMLSAVTIGIVLVAASGLVSWIPQPALAGIIIAVMVGIIDVGAIRTLMRGRRSELAVAVVAFVGVAAVGVLEGVAVAVALSVAVSALRSARPHDALLGRLPGTTHLVPLDEHAEAQPIEGIVVYRFDAPLFFGNAEMLREHVLAAVGASRTPVRHVLIAAGAITDLDYSASQVLLELGTHLQAQGATLVLADVNHRLLSEIDKTLSDATVVRFTTNSVDDVLCRLE